MSIDKQDITNTRVNDHLKQGPLVPPVSVLRQWIGVPDLLTEVTAAHVVIVVLANLGV